MKHDHADEIISAWRSEMPQLPFLPLQVAKRVARLNAMLDAACVNELTKLGITRAEYQVLATLRRVGRPYRLKPTELTMSALLSSGGTSNIVKRISDAGYVRRHEDPNDGRSSWVELTTDGVKMAETAVKRSLAAQEALLARIPATKIRALSDLLRQVLVALGDGATDAGEEPPTAAPPRPSTAAARRSP